jgi:methylated-DNA-[protein]-cysteine S-methyltransferase
VPFSRCSPLPLFPLWIEASERGIAWVRFALPPSASAPARPAPLVTEAMRQIEEYFAGRRRDFDLPLDLRGTPFQIEVWEMVRQIPYGETRGYGELARALGRPGAARAVGAANGANPVPILVPCHRVIGAGGALTGYGGGLDRKKFLLELESRSSGLFA